MADRENEAAGPAEIVAFSSAANEAWAWELANSMVDLGYIETDNRQEAVQFCYLYFATVSFLKLRWFRLHLDKAAQELCKYVERRH